MHLMVSGDIKQCRNGAIDTAHHQSSATLTDTQVDTYLHAHLNVKGQSSEAEVERRVDDRDDNL